VWYVTDQFSVNNIFLNTCRDVDCVITTIEVEDMLEKEGNVKILYGRRKYKYR
jgi:iron only hydrogenase large subunit-like protein